MAGHTDLEQNPRFLASFAVNTCPGLSVIQSALLLRTLKSSAQLGPFSTACVEGSCCTQGPRCAFPPWKKCCAGGQTWLSRGERAERAVWCPRGCAQQQGRVTAASCCCSALFVLPGGVEAPGSHWATSPCPAGQGGHSEPFHQHQAVRNPCRWVVLLDFLCF